MKGKYEKYKNIPVKSQTYTDLAKHGVYGDSWDDIVVKILNQLDNQKVGISVK